MAPSSSRRPAPHGRDLRATEHADETGERRQVLEAFVRDGRITSLPAARTKRLVLLDWVVQAFEPGVRYAERDVNELLAARHADTAMLRRYLVDEGLLDRAGGEYWRSGGTVAWSPSASERSGS